MSDILSITNQEGLVIGSITYTTDNTATWTITPKDHTFPVKDGVWVIKEEKAGNRHNRGDRDYIQEIHDKSLLLGAACPENKAVEDHKVPHYKAMDLGEMANTVVDAWFDMAFEEGTGIEVTKDLSPADMWVEAVFPDRIIVKDWNTAKLYSYGYTMGEESINFGEAVEVEVEFVAKTTETPTYPTEEGNYLKSISLNDQEWRLKNHIILWGSPEAKDLEGIASDRQNDDGSIGEYFSKDTQVESIYTKSGRLMVDLEHREQLPGYPDPEEVLGWVDWPTKAVDDKGIFVETVLDMSNRYVQWIQELYEQGVRFGTSSEPIQKSVQKGEDGHILSWQLYRNGITVKPMDDRMILENYLKSMEDEEGKKFVKNICGLDGDCKQQDNAGADQREKESIEAEIESILSEEDSNE